jgi:hypothetical protein
VSLEIRGRVYKDGEGVGVNSISTHQHIKAPKQLLLLPTINRYYHHYYYNRLSNRLDQLSNQPQNAIQRLLHRRSPRQDPPREPQRRLPSNLRPRLLRRQHSRHIPQVLHRLQRLSITPQHREGMEGAQEAPPRDEPGLLRLLRQPHLLALQLRRQLRCSLAQG